MENGFSGFLIKLLERADTIKYHFPHHLNQVWYMIRIISIPSHLISGLKTGLIWSLCSSTFSNTFKSLYNIILAPLSILPTPILCSTYLPGAYHELPFWLKIQNCFVHSLLSFKSHLFKFKKSPISIFSQGFGDEEYYRLYGEPEEYQKYRSFSKVKICINNQLNFSSCISKFQEEFRISSQ